MVTNPLRILFILVFAMCFGVANAQDVEFSQYYAAPLNLNPALTGVSYGPRFNLNYRNEWPNLQKGYVTYALSYDQHFEKLNSGFGIQFYNDRIAQGLINTYSIKINYAYQLRLSKKVGVQLGVNMGYVNKSVDFSRLTFNDQIDPIYGFQNPTGANNITQEQLPASNQHHQFDMGAGGVAYAKWIYGGVSFNHITRQKEAYITNDSTKDYRVPMRVNIHGGAIIRFSKMKRWEDFFLSPNILFTMQGGSKQLNAGVYGNAKYGYLGLFFRHNFGNPDAVIGVVGLKINFVRIGYSYDYTISALEHSGGAHELSLMINLGSDHGPFDPDRKQRRLECPTTFNF